MASSEGQQSGTYLKYLPLQRAAIKGDWESARKIFQEDRNARTALVNQHRETALHVVVWTGNSIHFVEELVKRMPKEALSLRNNYGLTAFFVAAFVGYTEAATILLQKDPSLLYIRDNNVTGQPLNVMIWEVIGWLVPFVKHIKDKKWKHHQALQVVKLLCKQLETLPDPKDVSSLRVSALLEAAIRGNPEVIEEIVDIFPDAIWCCNSSKHYMFHSAVLNRCENVFNLAHPMSKIRPAVMDAYDKKENNILHLAGHLAPRYKLNLVSGAALQMQYELQWFKEVEKFSTPQMRNSTNKSGKTPQEVFTEAHDYLMIKGQKWMKETANSCTIAAALIVTIVFAAAITVPGGNNNDNGEPNFLHKGKAFIIFAVSDTISLFTSTTSLLMFLSILTARYAESDFLYALPRKLIICLVTLFLSITFMMIAFGSTVYLMFGQGKAWVLIGVAAFASLPITSFVLLQFALLVDAISSTYGPGVFGKKSDLALH